MMTTRNSKDKRPRQVLWSLVLVFDFLVIGLVIGTTIGAGFVPAGSGMAGPAIALGYGFLGAFVGLVLAGLLIWKLSFRALRLTALLALGAVGVVFSLMAWRMMKHEQDRRAKYGLDQPLPATQSWTLSSRLPEQDSTRSFREIEVKASDWTFEFVATGPEQARCSGSLKASEAEGLAYLVPNLAARRASLCPDADEALAQMLSVSGLADSPSFEIELTKACIWEDEELADLTLILRRLPIDGVSEARVDCR